MGSIAGRLVFHRLRAFLPVAPRADRESAVGKWGVAPHERVVCLAAAAERMEGAARADRGGLHCQEAWGLDGMVPPFVLAGDAQGA